MWKTLIRIYSFEPVENAVDYDEIRRKAQEEGSDIPVFLRAVKACQKIARASSNKKNKAKDNQSEEIIRAWKEMHPTVEYLQGRRDEYRLAIRMYMKDFETYLSYLRDKVAFRSSLQNYESLSDPKQFELFLKRFQSFPDR